MDLSRRALLLGGATALLLSGCSRQQRTEIGSWPTEPPSDSASIVWWAAGIPSADGGDMRKPLIDLFQKKYPNITVRLVRAPRDTTTNRASLTTQIAAGSATPDVYMGDVAWPAQFAANGLAVPLDSLVAKDFWAQFPEGLQEATRFKDKAYMFPVYIDESFVFYRQDLLDKHGFSVPGSWEELADTSRKLIDAGDIDYGFIYQGSVYEGLTCSVTEFIADAGGSILNQKATAPVVDSSEGTRALEFLEGLVADGVTPRAALTYIEQSSMDAFASGRAAFLRNWSYGLDTANSEKVSKVAGKVKGMVRPGFDGMSKGNSTIGGWGNFINPHTQAPAAALTFAAFCASKEAQQLLVREGGVIPARTASLTSDDAKETGKPIYDIAKDITLVPRPTATPHYPKVSESIYTNANAAIGGQQSVSSALKEMSDGIERALRGEAL